MVLLLVSAVFTNISSKKAKADPSLSPTDRPFSVISEYTTGDVEVVSNGGSKSEMFGEIVDTATSERAQSVVDCKDAKKNSGIPLLLKSPSGSGSGTKTVSPKHTERTKEVSRSNSSSSPSSACRLNTPGTQSLEAQFKFKKRRLELMMKELTAKQKPIQDLYQGLLELKKRLDDAGINVKLSDVTLPIFDGQQKEEEPKKEIDPIQLDNIKNAIKRIPHNLMEFSKDLIHKRSAILQMLDHDPELIKEHLSVYEREGYEIESSLQQLFHDQEKKFSELVAFLQKIVESSNVSLHVPDFNEHLQKDLDRTKLLLKKKDDMLAEVNAVVKQLQAELTKKGGVEDEAVRNRQTVHELKHRIRVSIL